MAIKILSLFSILLFSSSISFAKNLSDKDISTYSPIIIKSTTFRAEPNNGDYFLANDFAKGFLELGFSTDIDYRKEYHRPHTPSPKVSIYMRGYTKFYPPFDAGINILYVYYPMTFNSNSSKKINKQTLNSRPPMPQNANLDDDFQNFDIIAVASPTNTKTLNQNGIKAIYIPQFTNPNKFYPAPKDDLKTDILFVGSNWHDRTSLRYAIEQGFDVSVYGYNWENVIPSQMYKAPYIPNDILNQYYSSAKIVLNDHRPDMKELGFINNRIYDATASGALVISDYMKEIEDIYHECIPMYKTKEELKELLNYYLTHEPKRKELAQCARQITLQKFTHTTVATQIINTLNTLK